MSHILNKPCTDEQYADFVIEYNHTKGLVIEETEEAVYALEVNEIIQNGVPVVNPDYEAEKAKAREDLFNKEFFETSLGYVKRRVTMQDGTRKDFLSDILSMLIVGVPIITYNAPDFNREELPTQNRDVLVTEQFINECKQQFLQDFYGVQKGK